MERKYIVEKNDFDAHVDNKNNPHGVTKVQVGLTNVDNTSDANKPISTAVQNALNGKANVSDLAGYFPKVGGRIDGVVQIENQGDNVSGNAQTQIMGRMGGSDYWRIGSGAGGADNGFVELATNDNGNEAIYVRQYQGSQGDFATLVRTATLLDGNGNTSFPGNLTVNGSLTVNGGGVGGIKRIQKGTFTIPPNETRVEVEISPVANLEKTIVVHVATYDPLTGSKDMTNVYSWFPRGYLCLIGNKKLAYSEDNKSTTTKRAGYNVIEFY